MWRTLRLSGLSLCRPSKNKDTEKMSEICSFFSPICPVRLVSADMAHTSLSLNKQIIRIAFFVLFLFPYCAITRVLFLPRGKNGDSRVSELAIHRDTPHISGSWLPLVQFHVFTSIPLRFSTPVRSIRMVE